MGVPITQPEEETNGSITVLDPVQEARASAAASMGVPLISLPKGKRDKSLSPLHFFTFLPLSSLSLQKTYFFLLYFSCFALH